MYLIIMSCEKINKTLQLGGKNSCDIHI
jgi:hypothetical protein